ncbi:HAD family hydrolase [Paenibacillus marinisediminis]
MKRWITFDLDGTLMQNPFGAWIFPEIEQVLATEYKQACDSRNRLYGVHYRLLQDQQLIAAYDWDAIVKQVTEELGLTAAINVEELVVKHATVPKIHLLEDTIVPVLSQLKADGYSLAAVTNGFYKYQYPVMKVLGLADLMDAIITPEMAGCAKPDCRMVDSLREDSVIVAHVGDRLDQDVVFANQLGAASILVHHQLPNEMLELSPCQRAESKDVDELLEKIAMREAPPHVQATVTDAYKPKYVIQSIGELLTIDQL